MLPLEVAARLVVAQQILSVEYDTHVADVKTTNSPESAADERS